MAIREEQQVYEARFHVVLEAWRSTTGKALRRAIHLVFMYSVLVAGALFFLFPLAWMAGTSLKTREEAARTQHHLLPEVPQWENYQTIIQDSAFIRDYFNSVFVAGMVLIGTVVSVTVVAYAFSRLRWKGRNVVFTLMMGTLMLPYQATLVPQYVLFYELEWLRTFNPITIPGFFAGGATLVFLLRQFMMTIPRELDEAAAIDGANPLQILWHVIVPLTRPAIITVSLFLFVAQWNSLLAPLIYLQKPELYTLPIYVAQKHNLQEPPPLPWHEIMAASVLFVIPVLVIFLVAQRYFTEGITLTGSKG
ncbi:MAG: carbohydrate ABC transporter permease [Chloroflexi bacterium]|nr:carbohydrate ABC transporter permease [Chloroflexota bacterium]